MPRTSPYSRLTDEQAKRMLRALDSAVEYAGTWSDLAERISCHTHEKISAQAVFRWATAGVPAERAVDIENALGGIVLRQDLRPDLYDGMRASD